MNVDACHAAVLGRRNAESLLVLAGVDPPRKWIAPVRLADVIRAALGEVEDYQRVTVHDVGSVTVAGSAAADLAHLLASSWRTPSPSRQLSPAFC